MIIDDIRDELRGRPYEIVSVAGGWSFRTKLGFGDAIRTALGGPQKDGIVEVERAGPDGDRVFSADHPRASCRSSSAGRFRATRSPRCAARGFIAAGPRSPTPGAPYAYVTTPGFLAQFGFESLRDLPDIEKLEDAGLLGRTGEGALGGDAWRPSCEGCWGCRTTKTSPRKMRRKAGRSLNGVGRH